MRGWFPNYLGSTTARFVALIFILQIVTTAGLLYYVHAASAAALLGEQKALVRELRDDLLAGYRAGGERQLTALIAQRLGSSGDVNAVILLARADGRTIAGNLWAWPTVVAPSTVWQELDLFRIRSSAPERIGLVSTRLAGGERLLTGQVLDGDLVLKRINEEAMIGAFLGAVPLALLIALGLARIVGRRVRAVASVAEAFDGGDLTRRVPEGRVGDSFDQLAHAVNNLLERIAAQLSELRIVTDGLAHDLRSPITRLKSVLERAIFDTRDPAALAALERASGEADNLLSMLSTALQISRAEAGIGTDRFETVELAELLGDIVEIYGPLAEDRGFTLAADAPPGATATLHRELVSQALGNLVDNALNYALGGTSIIVSAKQTPTGLELVVADNGPGIAPDQREEARRRFGRLDPARQLGGSGLGLSLVEAVARLHGGAMRLEDNAPGLKVVIGLGEDR